MPPPCLARRPRGRHGHPGRAGWALGDRAAPNPERGPRPGGRRPATPPWRRPGGRVRTGAGYRAAPAAAPGGGRRPPGRPGATRALLAEAERRGLAPGELAAVAQRHWPRPRLRARARPPAAGGRRAAPTGRGRADHAFGPSPWSSRSANRDRAGGAAASAAETAPHRVCHHAQYDQDNQYPQPSWHGGLLGRRGGGTG